MIINRRCPYYCAYYCEALSLLLCAGSSDPDGTISLYEWDFNYDGTTFTVDSIEANPVHIYPLSGTYTVALLVIDNKGASAIATTIVSITDTTTNACVEKTGILIAGNNNLANNIGQMDVFGENRVYTTYTESNLTDTHSKLMFCFSIDGGINISCSIITEFDHNSIGGIISHDMNVANDGTIDLV